MDELEISGKRYISTRRAASENNYHADYIGQLVRGGKVGGTKIGRAWYVEEVSLADYFKNESPKKIRPAGTAKENDNFLVAEKKEIEEVRIPVLIEKEEEADSFVVPVSIKIPTLQTLNRPLPPEELEREYQTSQSVSKPKVRKKRLLGIVLLLCLGVGTLAGVAVLSGHLASNITFEAR